MRKLVILLLVFCVGCSSMPFRIWPADSGEEKLLNVPIIVSVERRNGAAQSLTRHQSEALSSGVNRTPLEIEVMQAFFDEDELKIKIHLQSKIALDPSEIIVGVSGLEEGEVVEEHLQNVSEFVASDKLLPGHPVAMLFSLRSQNLTEYQVRCSWGDEAKTEKHQAQPLSHAQEGNSEPHPEVKAQDKEMRRRAAATPLSLEEVDVTKELVSCAEEPCDVLHTIKGKLVNNSLSDIGNIELAIGLYWTEQGALPRVPQRGAALTLNEESIRLGKVLLAPGAAKKIRVKVDRGVPVVPGGAFIPHLRIVHYEQAGN